MRSLALLALTLYLAAPAFAQPKGPSIRWSPAIRPPLLMASAAPAAATTGTAEETLYTYQLPKPDLQYGAWQARCRWLVTTSATAAAKVTRVRLGSLTGQELCSTTVDTPGALGAAMLDCQRISETSMLCTCIGGAAATGVATQLVEGVDFTTPVPIVITGETSGGAGELRLSSVRLDGR